VSVAATGIGLLATLGFLGSAALAVPRRSTPGVTAFIVMTVLLSALPLPLAGLEFDSVGPSLVLFAIFMFLSIAWLVFAFEYTGRGPTMTRWNVALLAGFGCVTVLGGVGAEVSTGTVRAFLLFANAVLQATVFAAVAYGLFLVARSLLRYDDLSRADAIVLSTAGGGLTTVWLLEVLTPELPAELLNLPQLVILAGMAGLFLLAQLRYDVFESGPSAGHLARETVFEEVGRPTLIVDTERRVLDCNRPAGALFGSDRVSLFGEPIGRLVERLDGDPSGALGIADEPVTLNTMQGHRQFQVRRSELTSGDGTPIGHAFVFEDVTERMTHEQRLDVLNRVLRHNLRNDLDAIHAFAETLAADATVDAAEASELVERIGEAARDLAALGETVGRTERLLSRDELDWGSVDVVSLVAGLADEFEARYPAATVDVTAGRDELTVHTDRRIFESAIAELVENAIEHSDRSDPHAGIAVGSTDGGVQVTVSDDGPGIPEEERAVLLDGVETALRHGSGVGLWFVHWGMVALGGQLDLADNQPRGSVVTLSVPSLATGATT